MPVDPAPSVRTATFDVLRRHGMTTIFSNPGSTEVPFLADLPDDLDFVLALHEGSVAGIASGWALARESPAFVLLHTTAGLGNAVGAIATARVNRVPLVVVVGQQDRRHLAQQPFLAGELEGLAGSYPLQTIAPVRAQDLPSAVDRAAHRARREGGPVVVIAPMDDWAAAYGPDDVAAAERVVEAVPTGVDVSELIEVVTGASRPVIVAGAGNDGAASWFALARLAERLDAPVWQEAFGARAGFPQDHRLFRGHLPAERSRARAALDGADLVIVVGAAAFRQYTYAPGPVAPPGARVVVVTADAAEAERSVASLAVIGRPATVVDALVDALGPPPVRQSTVRAAVREDDAIAAEAGLTASSVFRSLASVLPADAVVVEETPSSRPALHEQLPARAPFGFVSAAMGGLGFAMSASIGIRMALPDRPVVAVVGDGSAMYAIQSLWTAARLRIGVVCVVLANGRYAVMDRLAESAGGKAPWPPFPELSVARVAEALGCRTVVVDDPEQLQRALARAWDDPGEPLVIEAHVPPDAEFRP